MKEQKISQENGTSDLASEEDMPKSSPSEEENDERNLEAELQHLRSELEASQDRLLRSTAEFDNVRKRMLREKEQAIKFANEGLLHAILPFLDDLDRALNAHEHEQDSLYEGLALVRKKFLDTLSSQWKVQEISSVGETFDPLVHEAIAIEESKDVAGTIVIEEYQKGFMYHERVLRTAKVKVARKSQGQSEEKEQKKESEFSGEGK